MPETNTGNDRPSSDSSRAAKSIAPVAVQRRPDAERHADHAADEQRGDRQVDGIAAARQPHRRRSAGR